MLNLSCMASLGRRTLPNQRNASMVVGSVMSYSLLYSKRIKGQAQACKDIFGTTGSVCKLSKDQGAQGFQQRSFDTQHVCACSSVT
ncbi:hypothetical protein SpCBS45565_g02761 [Spizellomyces sp. 'palustris']|nr:hypothetical protein SpCBS45565_g02761 [Spizellomyces sp. 'palustris']